MRDPRYDCLFDPLAIGPVIAKNRFYQVPHCNGAGYRDPSAAAAMRGIKAEGGWGVIFTEQTEMHPTSEITPFIELRLWEDQDIPMIAKMADAMKSHGGLAGIQLAYSGINGPNFYSKEVPLAPTALPIRTFTNDPVQARAMDKQDIKNLRRWFVNAAIRSRSAGFDLICLYGAHGFGIFQHFLSRATNQRTDEYGGSLENRARFVREVIADLRDEVGDTMGLTLRLSLDEMLGDLGFANSEVRDFIVGGLFRPVPVQGRGRTTGSGDGNQKPDEQTRRRGRAVHQPRCDGATDQIRYPRFHWLRAALDCRSISAAKGRSGAGG